MLTDRAGSGLLGRDAPKASHRARRGPRAVAGPGGHRRRARSGAHVRGLRRPLERRRTGAARRGRAAVRGALRGLLTGDADRRVPARERAPGLRRVIVTWEPWRPVPARGGRRRAVPPAAGLSATATSPRRPGRLHRRLRAQPRRLPRHRRPALRARDERHWYPWSHDPIGVPLGVAPRRAPVPRGRRGQRALRLGANPSLYEPARTWRAGLRAIGRAAGTSARRLDDDRLRRQPSDYTVRPVRAAAARAPPLLPQALVLTETSTASPARAARVAARPAPDAAAACVGPLRCWSQHRSRGAQQIPGTGALDWDVRERSRGVGRAGRASGATGGAEGS